MLIVSVPVYWLSPPGVMKDFIDRTISVGTHPVPPFKDKKVALVTIAAENGFELLNELLSRWLRHYKAHIIGDIELYAWEKDDLVHDDSQIAKLKGFASEMIEKMQV